MIPLSPKPTEFDFLTPMSFDEAIENLLRKEIQKKVRLPILIKASIMIHLFALFKE